jgi:hypothetical protein
MSKRTRFVAARLFGCALVLNLVGISGHRWPTAQADDPIPAGPPIPISPPCQPDTFPPELAAAQAEITETLFGGTYDPCQDSVLVLDGVLTAETEGLTGARYDGQTFSLEVLDYTQIAQGGTTQTAEGGTTAVAPPPGPPTAQAQWTWAFVAGVLDSDSGQVPVAAMAESVYVPATSQDVTVLIPLHRRSDDAFSALRELKGPPCSPDEFFSCGPNVEMDDELTLCLGKAKIEFRKDIADATALLRGCLDRALATCAIGIVLCVIAGIADALTVGAATPLLVLCVGSYGPCFVALVACSTDADAALARAKNALDAKRQECCLEACIRQHVDCSP